jgi:hypothetical protein
VSEIVKYERPAIEGEVLPPETPRERAMKDPMYYCATLPQVPMEVFNYATFLRREMERASGAAPTAKEGTIVDRIPPTRTWNADPVMRRMGFTTNPDICIHQRKVYSPGFGWSCRDCGEPNLAQKSRLTP